MIRRPPSSPLFPSPPLSRSRILPGARMGERASHDHAQPGGPPHLPRGELDRELARRVTRHGRASSDRKSTRLNSSHLVISYAVFCLKKKKKQPPVSRQIPQN